MTECGGGGGESQASGNAEELSIPRGGPIYVPNLVTSLTSVPLFQSSLLLALQVLLSPFFPFILFYFFNFVWFLVDVVGSVFSVFPLKGFGG